MGDLILKKSIKYLGIAAAMLLAVAPIAMPVAVFADTTDSEGNVIPADGTYTDNGDGTYTLHGTLKGDIWTNGDKSHPTGSVVPVSIEGIKVNSTGDINLETPAINGYKSNFDTYELMLDGGDVYLYSGLLFKSNDPSTAIDENATPGYAYSTEFTLSKDAYTNNNEGTPILISGTRDFAKLPAGSSWKVDRKMYISGGTYYRVGNNTWVEKKYGTEKSANTNVVTTKNQAALFTKDGKKVNNRALAANTAWYTDKNAIINGQKMYHVATNEWVSANDIK